MEAKYICLSKAEYSLQNYSIESIRATSIETIRGWRNSQRLYLRQDRPVTAEQQSLYFSEFVWPGFTQETPDQILFELRKDQTLVAYGGLVHISWKDRRAEVSFLSDPRRAAEPVQYREDFLSFLSLVRLVAFEDLKLHRLFTETFDLRDFHVSILEESGFQLEGRLKEHVYKEGKYIDCLIHGLVNES